MPRFADQQLADLVAQPAPAPADLDVHAMRLGIAKRRGSPAGTELHRERRKGAR